MPDKALVGSHLDVYTFQELIADALAQVPDTVDKRQGSIIYDTLAVGDVQLAQGFVVLKGYYLDAYALTAEGDYLDLRVAEAGLTRYPATHAVKLGQFADLHGEPVSISLGSRFSTIEDTKPIVFVVTEPHTVDGEVIPGSYRMTCEIAGTAGNDYVGPILPVEYQRGVATATLTDLLIPGRDAESDEDLRARYIEYVNRPPFGGNVAHYRMWVLEMDGVGAVQVYPIWRGGGTVKVSIIGADYSPASDTLIEEVQTALDPIQNSGLGLGLAPIGHRVTVATPESVPIDIDANIQLFPGVQAGQVLEPVRERVSAYLLERRKRFGAASDTNLYAVNIYRARISTAIMEVDGVENVPDVLINGKDEDLILVQSGEVQQLPVDGVVNLHAV